MDPMRHLSEPIVIRKWFKKKLKFFVKTYDLTPILTIYYSYEGKTDLWCFVRNYNISQQKTGTEAIYAMRWVSFAKRKQVNEL